MLASAAPLLRQATVTCSYADQVTIYNCRNFPGPDRTAGTSWRHRAWSSPAAPSPDTARGRSRRRKLRLRDIATEPGPGTAERPPGNAGSHTLALRCGQPRKRLSLSESPHTRLEVLAPAPRPARH